MLQRSKCRYRPLFSHNQNQSEKNKSKYNLNKEKCMRYNIRSLHQPHIKKDYDDRLRTLCNELDEKEIIMGI
jgi:hypothetical protein